MNYATYLAHVFRIRIATDVDKHPRSGIPKRSRVKSLPSVVRKKGSLRLSHEKNSISFECTLYGTHILKIREMNTL